METKGKSINTSVPSIRFKANVEEVEEFYQSDEDVPDETKGKHNSSSVGGETESSPFRYLPRLRKRSTSIDTSLAQDSSPPSDPWRFFSEIKGKITKRVEDRITEIKHRNQDADESLHKIRLKEGRDSDSDDISESSISRTCGAISTTEGVEMSSDEESLFTDNKKENTKTKESHLRKRFNILRKGSKKETSVGVKVITDLYELNTGVPVLPTDVKRGHSEERDDIESGVEAFEDVSFHITENNPKVTCDEILKDLAQQIDNIEIDASGSVNVKVITGKEIEKSQSGTFLSPVGFVDLRSQTENDWTDPIKLFLHVIVLIIGLFICFSSSLPPGITGFITGSCCTYIIMLLYYKFVYVDPSETDFKHSGSKILEIPAVKEYQPSTKFEGWLNEYPSNYSPQTYHITHTQPVYLRLQGSLLRLSHTKSKIPKRAMWNESKHKPSFTHQRIYNIQGAKITLLPENLTRKRLWSKKYPICITLTKDQINFEYPNKDTEKIKDVVEIEKRSSVDSKSSVEQKQVFSKLTEEDGTELESECSRASSPSPEASESSEDGLNLIDSLNKSKLHEEGDWVIPELTKDSADTNIYLFGRTDREKEDWYRRLIAATHEKHEAELSVDELNYIKFMSKVSKLHKINGSEDNKEFPQDKIDVVWVNCLLGRVLFDCVEDLGFAQKLRDHIQRKLSSIKLPYFIEQLIVSELTLGNHSPIIHRASLPTMDQRGLWIDLDITYEGGIVLTLQTKLNLMKLKQPPASDLATYEKRSAKWQNSDLEDSAESSSDEETPFLPTTGKILEEVPSGSSRTASKKFIKMVDRIAESKFFQAATDNRYIKKAMEEISNTDLALKVEIKGLTGTLVLNIPPPPTDRVWLGFKPSPKLTISAHPIVGERNISYIKQLTSWIEKKLHHEFQKLMVIPNMEDVIIPVMSQKLPK